MTNVGEAAFTAAYEALEQYGVRLAQVRADVADRIVSDLIFRRAEHGMGHMLTLAQGVPNRRAVVTAIREGLPAEFSSVSMAAVDAAVASAARVLAEVSR